MRGWKDFGSVRIERAVVDVDEEVNGASEAKIFGVGTDGGVGKEEGAGYEGTDHHRIPKRTVLVKVANDFECSHQAHLRPKRVVHIQPARIGPKIPTALLMK